MSQSQWPNGAPPGSQAHNTQQPPLSYPQDPAAYGAPGGFYTSYQYSQYGAADATQYGPPPPGHFPGAPPQASYDATSHAGGSGPSYPPYSAGAPGAAYGAQSGGYGDYPPYTQAAYPPGAALASAGQFANPFGPDPSYGAFLGVDDVSGAAAVNGAGYSSSASAAGGYGGGYGGYSAPGYGPGYGGEYGGQPGFEAGAPYGSGLGASAGAGFGADGSYGGGYDGGYYPGGAAPLPAAFGAGEFGPGSGAGAGVGAGEFGPDAGADAVDGGFRFGGDARGGDDGGGAWDAYYNVNGDDDDDLVPDEVDILQRAAAEAVADPAAATAAGGGKGGAKEPPLELDEGLGRTPVTPVMRADLATTKPREVLAALERECTSLKRLQHLYSAERAKLVREEAILLHLLQLTDPAGDHVASVRAQVAAATEARTQAREARAQAFERAGEALSYFTPAYVSPVRTGDAADERLAAEVAADVPDQSHTLEAAIAARAAALAAARPPREDVGAGAGIDDLEALLREANFTRG